MVCFNLFQGCEPYLPRFLPLFLLPQTHFLSNIIQLSKNGPPNFQGRPCSGAQPDHLQRGHQRVRRGPSMGPCAHLAASHGQLKGLSGEIHPGPIGLAFIYFGSIFFEYSRRFYEGNWLKRSGVFLSDFTVTVLSTDRIGKHYALKDVEGFAKNAKSSNSE